MEHGGNCKGIMLPCMAILNSSFFYHSDPVIPDTPTEAATTVHSAKISPTARLLSTSKTPTQKTGHLPVDVLNKVVTNIPEHTTHEMVTLSQQGERLLFHPGILDIIPLPLSYQLSLLTIICLTTDWQLLKRYKKSIPKIKHWFHLVKNVFHALVKIL